MKSQIGKPPLRPAGGFEICDGGPGFKLVKRRQIQPWRKAVKKVLLSKPLRRRDARIAQMHIGASLEWSFYSRPPYHHWPNLTPLEKQAALFSFIREQKKRDVVDILASGIAGDLFTTYGPQALKTPYARAVNVARPIWFLLRQEYRDYTMDNGHGIIRVQRVCVNRKVRLRSRHACQRIEANIRKHAGWFLEEYRGRLLEELRKAELI